MSELPNSLIIPSDQRNSLIPSDQKLNLSGLFYYEQLRKIRGRYKLIDRGQFFNAIVNEGKNYAFNVAFNGATAIAQSVWATGFIDGSTYSAISATDTMASHAGWTEFVLYNETVRPAWGPVTSTAQQVQNTTAAVFTIASSVTTGSLQGVIIVGNNTKGGTTGPLWTTALFPSPVPITATDILRILYGCAA